MYLDSFISFDGVFEDRLILILCRLREAELKIKKSKCRLFIRKFTFLAYFVEKRRRS